MAISKTILPCLIFWFSCFTIAPITYSSNESDLLSLLAFKAAIHDPLGALRSWNETSNYCSWKGIRCGYKHRDRVVGINLMSQGLVGSLSTHIGNLSFLRRIILQNNTFHGQIPKEISLLRRLEIVEFSNNSFTGAIPTNISLCPNLFYLNLIDNSLSGIIPAELGFLYKLEALSLTKNKLSGSIPPSIGNLTSLIEISLVYCGLTGEIPESLGQLQSLKYLFLGLNSLTGRIPSGLYNISTINIFQVAGNQLQGVIPASIGLTLPNLKEIYLRENHFSGEVLISLSNATLLEIIDIESNSFKGSIPMEFGRLSSLQFFGIRNNSIEDDISFISTLTNCTKLKYLVVGSNLLSGSLPDSIANLSNQIIELEISNTQIHGNIPLGIRNLISVTRLLLDDNYFEGPIPFSIGKLFNLHEIYLERNKFTNKIPYSLGNLTLLNILSLGSNSFFGTIPQSLSNCTSLLSFDLSDNNLNGSIPQEIMSLSSISILFNLSNNVFTGSIPIEVGSFTNLANIDLSNNRLSGQIPNSLSSCISLQWLRLEGNLLQGEIPLGLSALKGLQELDLSQNNLSGKIPIFLGNLNLELLNLSFNRLQGEVPIVGVFRNKTQISLDGNQELCGGLLELKLPPCSSTNSSKKGLSTLMKILIPTLVVGSICFLLSACFFIHMYRQRIRKKIESSSMTSFIGVKFMRLSYGDLLKATGGFSEENLVGAGRFGSVYKGMLEDGKTMVAVKVLNLFVKGAFKSFMAECNALKNIRHRNLLKILSVCESIDFQRNEFKALIYEFMANGSLEKILHHNREQEEHDAEFKSLNMIQRLKIAIDIAQALEYLHFGNNSTVVHGDLKPSNILLDNEMTAHVGDFGLAKIVSSILPGHESSSSIGIKGTIGYVPPEYGTSGLMTTQGDVYSYGILLMEIFTSKRPTDDSFSNHVSLHNFVSSALPDRIIEIVDPSILIANDMNINKMKNCMVSILSIGVGCSKEIPKERMLMTDVVHELCKIRDEYLS